MQAGGRSRHYLALSNPPFFPLLNKHLSLSYFINYPSISAQRSQDGLSSYSDEGE